MFRPEISDWNTLAETALKAEADGLQGGAREVLMEYVESAVKASTAGEEVRQEVVYRATAMVVAADMRQHGVDPTATWEYAHSIGYGYAFAEDGTMMLTFLPAAETVSSSADMDES